MIRTQTRNGWASTVFTFAGVVGGLLLIAGHGPGATAQPWRSPAYGSEAFKNRWYDGKAEMASYTLTYPRYGELRSGTAVAITVTEPFNPQKRVKADSVQSDTYNVVKLNLAEDFQTGVYDYNLMTSVFIATEPVHGLPAGAATKVSFSSQEWCGHVWQQARFGGPGNEPEVQQTSHSYFEAEADQTLTLPHPENGLAEDAIILWARGLAGPALNPGKSVTVPMYRSMAVQRLQHVPGTWDQATLTHETGTHAIETALGTFDCSRLTVTIRSAIGQRRYVLFVDQADEGQRRLIQLERSDGYRLSLTGVDRMPYWSMGRNADENQLKRLNLIRRAPGAM